MIVVLVGLVGAEEIKVAAREGPVGLIVLEDDYAVLDLDADPRLIRRHHRGEVHQDKKLTRLEDRPRDGVLMALGKWRR